MEINSNHKKINTALLILSFVIILSYLGVFFAIGLEGMEYFSTPDMYSDQLVAKLMWEQKTFFPENWLFGNQYNIISTPAFTALFYGLTGNMNLSMVLATALMTLFIIGAFIFAFRPFCSPLKLSLGLMTLLGCCICAPAAKTIEGQIFYILASYYSCYLAVLLVVWGDFARLLTKKRKCVFSASFAAALILSFGAGLQSLRQTAVMLVPMAAFEFFRLLYIGIKNKWKFKKSQLKPLWAAMGYALSNFLGLVTIKLIGPSQTSIYGSLGLEPFSEYLSNLSTDIRALRSVTGLKYVLEDGFHFLPFLLWLSFMGLLIFFFVKFIKNRKQKKALEAVEICTALGVLSMLGLLFVNIVVDMEFRSIYLFSWYPLAAFLVMLGYSALKGKAQQVFALIMCLLITGNLFFSYVPCIKEASKSGVTVREEISNWIKEGNYQILYGQWWYVNTVAPYADGEYITAPWSEDVFKILSYINVDDAYDEEDNKNAVYLIMADEKEKAFAYAKEQGGELKLKKEFADGAYGLYTATKQLMHW